MSYLPEITQPALPVTEVNLQPGSDERISPVPPELTELAKQVDAVYHEELLQGIGDVSTTHLLPTAGSRINTGGHEGGSSQGENDRVPVGGNQTNDRSSGSTTSGDKSSNGPR